MSPEQKHIAKLRLRLGITNVGFWVVAASIGLVWLTRGDAAGLDARGLLLIFAVVLLLQSCFDFIGGTILRIIPRPSVTEFLKTWGRGFFTHTMVLLALAFLHWECFKLTGGFCGALVVGIGLLAFSRKPMLRLVAGISLRPAKEMGIESDYVIADATDSAFTGGVVGIGARAQIVIPERWLEIVPAKELEAELFRRRWQVQNGLPRRSLLGLLVWNLFGCTLGQQLLGLAGRGPYEALFGYACGMTLWAFVGLLILPKLSHAAVLAADRAAAAAGLDVEAWIKRFPDLVGEDGSDRAAIQRVFYPIPSREIRLKELEQAGSMFVLGNLARNNLYYSLATLTLLGRAVHCNGGRPALWIFPPTD